ncbi:MAG: A24 family peptidase [Gemmatimonadota bacterium]
MSPPIAWIFTSSVFVALMCAAVWTDATTGRLPNRITVTAVVAGLAVRLLTGPGALLGGATGLLLGLALGIPFFIVGAIAGGDVKLLAAVGAFLGPGELLWGALLGAALGFFVVVEEIVRRRVSIPMLLRTKDLLAYAVTLGKKGRRPSPGEPGSVSVPYGIAIAAGAIAAWFLPFAEVVR